jgi:hypothetical protein
MLIEYDQTTMANMTAALDSVRRKIPSGFDSHETRKRIADAMIACARTGKRTFTDFRSAGMRVLDEMPRPRKFSWFGLLRGQTRLLDSR